MLYYLQKLTLLAFFVLLTSMLMYVGLLPILFNSHALDPVEEIQREIDELENLKRLSQDATKPLESELKNLNARISSAQQGIKEAQSQANQVSKNIEDREEDLAVQYIILSKRIAEQYKRHRVMTPLLIFLSSANATKFTQDIAYRNSVEAQDNRLITTLGDEIEQLEADRVALEARQKQLAALQVQLNEQARFFATEIAKAEDYQAQLSGKIAALSAKQQEIINARSGSFTVSGDSELADDYLASIVGFRESAPGGYFGVFSFGGYSHRNGMSQYGALGRAKQGQDYKQILNAYYPNASIKENYAEMDQITVDGHGTGSFEDWYLHRIYEVPASWPKEVLKAQAIAARTYAIRRTNNGQSSICTTEACQVFKNAEKGGAWSEAVRETRGMVLVDGGGNPVSTQYASTHGGWTKTSGWDTTNGSGGSDFLNNAYEKIGGSPWLYKSWWRAGYSSSGDTCGRANPWLSPEEMADIVNAAVALRTGGVDTSRVLPVTTSCWGGNPYSMSELRDLVKGKGGISSASNVSVSLGEGRTNTVTINGVSMSGDEFCKAFNLRAPGNLRIPQWSGASCSGAFFNIEKK